MKIFFFKAKSAGEVNIDDERILIYRRGQAPPVSGQPTHRKVLYSSTNALPISSARKGLRHIPTTPERILDAPNYIDDYCKLLFYIVCLFIL